MPKEIWIDNDETNYYWDKPCENDCPVNPTKYIRADLVPKDADVSTMLKPTTQTNPFLEISNNDIHNYKAHGWNECLFYMKSQGYLASSETTPGLIQSDLHSSGLTQKDIKTALKDLNSLRDYLFENAPSNEGFMQIPRIRACLQACLKGE